MPKKSYLTLLFILFAFSACSSPEIELETQFSDSVNQGLEYVEQEQFDLAIEAFSKIIAEDPQDGEAWLNRGLAYYEERLHEQANADFAKAFELGLEPTSADLYIKRGRAYSIGGNLESAIADFNQALVLNPESAEAYLRRGHVYTSIGEIQLAISDLDQAIALDPNYALAYQKRDLQKRNWGIMNLQFPILTGRSR